MKKTFLALALVGVAACGSASTTSTAKDAPAFAASSPAPLAIHIRHISTGAGIDSEAAAEIRSVLGNELGAGNLVRYVFKRVEGAHEGESDSCAEFKSMDEMNRVRELLDAAVDGSNLVQLATASDCKGSFWGN